MNASRRWSREAGLLQTWRKKRVNSDAKSVKRLFNLRCRDNQTRLNFVRDRWTTLKFFQTCLHTDYLCVAQKRDALCRLMLSAANLILFVNFLIFSSTISMDYIIAGISTTTCLMPSRTVCHVSDMLQIANLTTVRRTIVSVSCLCDATTCYSRFVLYVKCGAWSLSCSGSIGFFIITPKFYYDGVLHEVKLCL